MKRHEMNDQATICNRQKAVGSRLLAVGCLLLVASCRAPAPQTGRYQWNIVSHEGEEDKIYVIDSATGTAARWDGSAKKWCADDAMPDSLPDWKSIREKRKEQIKRRAEQEKQAKEAREKRAALVKAYSQMPLEKQVAWAKDIKICKFMGMRRENKALRPYFESYESLKGQYSSSGYRHPYKSTDDNLVVWFKAIVDGEDLSFGLSHTPIDSKGVFLAPETIIDDVKAEIKRQAAKQEEAHAENH